MVEEATLEFRLKKIEETRNFILDELEHSSRNKHVITAGIESINHL